MSKFVGFLVCVVCVLFFAQASAHAQQQMYDGYAFFRNQAIVQERFEALVQGVAGNWYQEGTNATEFEIEAIGRTVYGFVRRMPQELQDRLIGDLPAASQTEHGYGVYFRRWHGFADQGHISVDAFRSRARLGMWRLPMPPNIRLTESEFGQVHRTVTGGRERTPATVAQSDTPTQPTAIQDQVASVPSAPPSVSTSAGGVTQAQLVSALERAEADWMRQLEERLQEISRTQDEHEQRLDGIERERDRIQAEVGDIHSLQAEQGQQLTTLQGRVDQLDTVLEGLSDQVGNLQAPEMTGNLFTPFKAMVDGDREVLRDGYAQLVLALTVLTFFVLLVLRRRPKLRDKDIEKQSLMRKEDIEKLSLVNKGDLQSLRSDLDQAVTNARDALSRVVNSEKSVRNIEQDVELIRVQLVDVEFASSNTSFASLANNAESDSGRSAECKWKCTHNGLSYEFAVQCKIGQDSKPEYYIQVMRSRSVTKLAWVRVSANEPCKAIKKAIIDGRLLPSETPQLAAA